MKAREFIDRYSNESFTDGHCETLYADWLQLVWSNLNDHGSKEVTTHHISKASAVFFKVAEKCEQFTHLQCHLPDRHSPKSHK